MARVKVFHKTAGENTGIPCGINYYVRRVRCRRLWADVTCKNCLRCRPKGKP